MDKRKESNEKNMKITYDKIADAMYIYLAKNKKSTRTETLGDDLNIDFNHNKLIGIEILDASKKLPKQDLMKNDLIYKADPTFGAQYVRDQVSKKNKYKPK